MKILKGDIYIHFYFDIDGLKIDIISLSVDYNNFDTNHNLKSLFYECLNSGLIDAGLVEMASNYNLKLMGFSTVEGQKEIKY